MVAKNLFWRRNAIYYDAEKILLLRRKIPQINPRNTTQTFKIVSRKFLTASVLYFYAVLMASRKSYNGYEV